MEFAELAEGAAKSVTDPEFVSAQVYTCVGRLGYEPGFKAFLNCQLQREAMTCTG